MHRELRSHTTSVSDARARSKPQSRTNLATHCWFCAGLSLLSACSGAGRTKPSQLEAADAGQTDKPHAQKVSWAESANHKADQGGTARVLSVRAVVPEKVTAGDTFRVVCELSGDSIKGKVGVGDQSFDWEAKRQK